MGEIIIALVAFTVSLIALMTPIIKLNATITKLDTTVALLNKNFTATQEDNKKAHKEFYNHLDKLDKEVVQLNTKMNIYHKQVK